MGAKPLDPTMWLVALPLDQLGLCPRTIIILALCAR